MKPLKRVISDEAVSDLVDLWTYIAENNPKCADQFVDQIYAKCETLTEPPMMGRERKDLLPGMRSFPVVSPGTPISTLSGSTRFVEKAPSASSPRRSISRRTGVSAP